MPRACSRELTRGIFVSAEAKSRLLQETLLSLSQAGRRFPRTRSGRSPHLTPSAVWRWVVDGVRAADGGRVKLDAVFVAGRWLTSIEAIERFVQAQQPQVSASDMAPSQTTEPTSPVEWRRNAEHDGAELDRLGL